MTTETEVLDAEELANLLAVPNRKTLVGCRNYALLQLMAQTGIRCNEALQVEEKDIREEKWDDDGRKVKVHVLRLKKHTTKGKKARQGIPLTNETLFAIREWLDRRAGLEIKSGPLFCTITQGKAGGHFTDQANRNYKLTPEQVQEIRLASRDTDRYELAERYGVSEPTVRAIWSGQRYGATDDRLVPGAKLNSRYVRNIVEKYARAAGIEKRVHVHMFRHTALTNLWDRTQNLRLVQDVAGHSTSRMTERYTHVHPVSVARAMGVV